MPELQREIPELNKQVLADMKADGYRGELEDARKERNKRLKQMVRRQCDDLCFTLADGMTGGRAQEGPTQAIRLYAPSDHAHPAYHTTAPLCRLQHGAE